MCSHGVLFLLSFDLAQAKAATPYTRIVNTQLLREQEITQIPFIVFYSRIQVPGTPSLSLVRQAARRLKVEKPSWGSAFPRSKLHRQVPYSKICTGKIKIFQLVT
jgi:hypothetical protein